MHFRLVAGRQFTPDDHAGSPLVAILNEEAARRYFPGSDPVGRELSLGSSGTRRAQIVGVVANDRHDGARAPVKVEMFVPHAQRAVRRVTLVVEPTGDAGGAVTAVRAAMREADPMMPVGAIRSLDDITRQAMEQPRVYATLVGAFALAALLLAALGVYGVQAYSVVQREREIGVRLALGSAPSGIRNIVLRDAGKLAAIGLAVGLIGAIAAGRLAGALLYGVNAADAPTLITVAVVLALVTLLAAWVPARRALRVDPLTSMRQE
jgi:putative ABC transport system permease protein